MVPAWSAERFNLTAKQVGYGTPAALKIDYNLPDGNDLFIGTVWPHGATSARHPGLHRFD